MFPLLLLSTVKLHSEVRGKGGWRIKGMSCLNFDGNLKGGVESSTRWHIIFIIDEDCAQIKVRTDLMDSKFPSIWCEEVCEYEKNLLIGGFYREWSHEGKKSAAILFRVLHCILIINFRMNWGLLLLLKLFSGSGEL